jgi:hypothetical protein
LPPIFRIAKKDRVVIEIREERADDIADVRELNGLRISRRHYFLGGSQFSGFRFSGFQKICG